MQAASGQQLGGEKKGVFMPAIFDNFQDMGIVECGNRLRFAFKALGEKFSIFQVRLNDLEGDVMVHIGSPRAINPRHAAFAEQRHHLILANAFPTQRGHFRSMKGCVSMNTTMAQSTIGIVYKTEWLPLRYPETGNETSKGSIAKGEGAVKVEIGHQIRAA